MSLFKLFDAGPQLPLPYAPKLLNISERIALLYLCTSTSDSTKLASLIKNQSKTYYLRQISNRICSSLITYPFLNKTVVTYIPSSPNKVKSRGFEHTKVFSGFVAKRLGLKHTALLKSQKERASQVSLTPEGRMDNIKKAFAPISTDAKDVILAEDVITTGATFFEAAATLRVNRVLGICLAAHPEFVNKWA